MGVLSRLSLTPQSVLATVLGGGVVCYAFYTMYRRVQSRSAERSPLAPDRAAKRQLLLSLLSDGSKVHIANREKVKGIIKRMISDGATKLQVISDFDRTLTPTRHSGAPVPSCHCVLEQHGDLPPHIKEAADKVRDYYLNIEFDPNMTREEKYPYMVEWWTKAHDFLVQSALTKAQLHQAVADSNLYLRDGCQDMLQFLHRHAIPLLIFSAGLGDIIESLLQQRYTLYENIKIVSNWMDFNGQGTLTGFKGTNIHVFNKNAHAIEHSDYFDKNRERSNIILLGDSLGDLDMAEGAPVIANILKVGYLNDKLMLHIRRRMLLLHNRKNHMRACFQRQRSAIEKHAPGMFHIIMSLVHEHRRNRWLFRQAHVRKSFRPAAVVPQLRACRPCTGRILIRC